MNRKIIFTRYAEEKLAQRGISKELVFQVLSLPDFIRPGYGNREVAYKKFYRNYLAVIFIDEGFSCIVITAHWVAKVKNKR